MGYCLVTDVASDFKNITFDATSTVTDTEVQNFIDQESAFIDSMICSVYAVPVTGVNSLLILKRIAIFLAADRVRHVLYTKTGQDNKDQDTKGLRSLSRDPRGDLKKIQDGTLKLGDAVALTENIGFDTGTDVPDCDHRVFDVGRQQW
jgi:hypothetical protein